VRHSARHVDLRVQAARAAEPGSREPLGDEVMLFVLETTKIDHHWSSLKADGDTKRRILAPAVALADFRDDPTKAHAEQIKNPLQSSNAHWPIVYCQLGGLDDLEAYLSWGTMQVKVRVALLWSPRLVPGDALFPASCTHDDCHVRHAAERLAQTASAARTQLHAAMPACRGVQVLGSPPALPATCRVPRAGVLQSEEAVREPDGNSR
jgi:hypothetical protein